MSDSDKLCTVDGCGSKHFAKGLCCAHYSRERYQKASTETRKALLASQNRWRRENAQHVSEMRKAQPCRAPGRYSEKDKERARTWYENNKDKALATAKRHYENSKEKILASQRQDRVNNPGKYRMKNRALIDNLADVYVRTKRNLPLDTPQEIVDVYRLLMKIRREIKK